MLPHVSKNTKIAPEEDIFFDRSPEEDVLSDLAYNCW